MQGKFDSIATELLIDGIRSLSVNVKSLQDRICFGDDAALVIHPDVWYTSEQLSARLQYTARTINEKCIRGEIPSNTTGSKRMIKGQDMLNYLEKTKQKSAAEAFEKKRIQQKNKNRQAKK